METASFDVAVIGSGPSGATFVRELARSAPSRKILLIGRFSKEKMCGGLLAPDAQKALARFNLTLPKNVLSDPQIFAVETVDLSLKTTRLYQRHYLNMKRKAFDDWLVSMIPESVTLIDADCTAIVREEGGFRIQTNAGTFFSAYLIGADGANSIVRSTFFPKLSKQYVSIQQWFDPIGRSFPAYACIFDPSTSDSCSWIIQKEDGLIFGGAFPKRDCRKRYETQKRNLETKLRCSLGTPRRTEACLLSSPRKPTDFRLAKGSVFLIGEAAGLISSSSFEGISSAMLSGKHLADAFSCGKNDRIIRRKYRFSVAPLIFKLYLKIGKRFVLCSPLLRKLILLTGLKSIRRYPGPGSSGI
ncbi:MAG: FAD-binding protein [Clostridia bacterium]|nr:FAD-binding protein [Clostridia bacterium]